MLGQELDILIYWYLDMHRAGIIWIQAWSCEYISRCATGYDDYMCLIRCWILPVHLK